MAVECNIFRSVHLSGVSERKIKKVVFFVLENLKKNGSVSVHFIGDKRIKSLNKKYRGKNTITDVLSFGMGDSRGIFFSGDDLGDIFVCVPQIKKQAKRNRVSFLQELYRILIHGLLHLLGYDHIKKIQAKRMFGLQEKLLKNCYEFF